MKCVSYDYGFENHLATKWKTLDNATPRESAGTKQPKTQQKSRSWVKKKQEPTSDYTEDEGGTPTSVSRDHLPRKARGEALKKPPASVGGADSALEELTDDEDYHDAM